MPPEPCEDAVAGPDLDLELRRRSIPVDLADALLEAVLEEVRWRQDEIAMFGRRVPVPRLTSWIGDEGRTYTYSGLRLDPRPWTPGVEAIRRHVEAATGEGFNSVLVNRYRDGSDGVGWHADDEPELGPDPVIASVSLGATRRFRLKRRDDPAVTRELALHHGDVLVMRGPTQRSWLHQVPKTARPVGERVNLTFRTIVEPGRDRTAS